MEGMTSFVASTMSSGTRASGGKTNQAYGGMLRVRVRVRVRARAGVRVI